MYSLLILPSRDREPHVREWRLCDRRPLAPERRSREHDERQSKIDVVFQMLRDLGQSPGQTQRHLRNIPVLADRVFRSSNL